MAFQYEEYRNPFTQSIGQLLEQKGSIEAQRALQVGQAQARAAEASGQAWGGAVQTLGQLPQQVMQQQRQAQMQALDVQKTQAQIGDMQAQQKEREAAAQKQQRLDQMNQGIDTLMKNSFKDDPQTGVSTFDRPTFEQGLVQSGMGHLYPQMAETLDKLDASAAKRNAESRVMLANTLDGIAKAGYTPEAVMSGAAYLKKNNLITQDHLAPVLDAVAADSSPQAIQKVVDGLGQSIPEYRQLQDAEAKRKADLAKTVAETSKLKAEVDGTLPKPQRPTAEIDKQKYIDIQARISQRQPVSKDELAWAAGFEKEKTIGPEASAAAASDRQAATMAQQNAIQQRAQDFQISQAGRKELTDKVEMPYQTAMASAQTLRDTVAAAKTGNLTAAAMQNLETTFAAIKSQGLNRVNMAEIGINANAGSIWDRLQGSFGKLKDGQPVDPKIQQDMVEFAGILEKAARKKYQDGFAAVTKRYGLKDEKPIVAPEAAPAPGQPIKVGGFTVTVK